MRKYPKLNNHQQDQRGIVSLLVVSILAIVLSLVAIGFSHLSNRELRQAVDRDLESQAYYAAESGLNDARAYLAAGGSTLTGCSDWKDSALGKQYFVSDLSGGTGAASYSCISIEDSPQTLSYSLKAGESKVVKLSAANLGKLYFGWENQSYPNTGPKPLGNPVGVLPREDTLDPAATGILRVGIYPVPQGDTSDTNDNLSTLSREYYMYPNLGSGSPGSRDYTGGGYDPASGPKNNNGDFVPGNCNVSRPVPINNSQAIPSYCNSFISGLNGSANTYYVYLTAMYAPLFVRLQATDSTANNKALAFTGTQGVVDVTGRGSDEIQRIRARIDLSNQYNYPSFAVQSMEALCKGFSLEITGLGQYGDATVNGSIPNPDNACAVPSGGGGVGSPSGDQGPH